MRLSDTRTSRGASRLAGAAASTAPRWQRSMDHLLYGPAAQFVAKGRDWKTTEIIRCRLDAFDGLLAALNYITDMTYCGTDAEWHFKSGYDPQHALDAIEKAAGSAVGDCTDQAPPAEGA